MHWGAVLDPRFFVLGQCAWTLATTRALNVTVDNTDPHITYIPPACNVTLNPASTAACTSSWQILRSANASGGSITSTSGPTVGGGDLIPQLFLTVRALSLFINTSSSSTAIANISLSTSDPVISITTLVNTSVGVISAIGLHEDEDTTLAITFVVTDQPTRLDIDSITIEASDNNTTPVVSPSLPPSASLPTSSATSSPTQPSNSRTTHSSGDIAAEVLGAVLGAVLLTLGFGTLVYFRRKRHRRPTDVSVE
ncbi:hypothetical protein A0H81_06457 [Grifola frondosa]|uniref:Uncharacterized protein n=1 Tax=Grifola frondosa TaxID=5627 RepID=A0A1C7MB60_GRIFR|nr:hypothetical protein A0H81_06457 [Grifola frondosa]